jgi:hypothetical protein
LLFNYVKFLKSNYNTLLSTNRYRKTQITLDKAAHEKLALK